MSKKDKKKNSPAAKISSAKSNLNLAISMIAACKGYAWSARILFKDLRELVYCYPTAEDCKNKLAEIDSYLANNSDIASKFETVKEGNGCTGRLFLETAREIIATI